jgi:hypothetical protein
MTLDIAQYIGTQPLPYGKANGRQMTEQPETKRYEVYFRWNDSELASLTVAGDLFTMVGDWLIIVRDGVKVAAFPVDMVLGVVERDR